MPGGSRPRRNTKSIYARAPTPTGIDDEALEVPTSEETRSRRRTARQQLFPSDDVQETGDDGEEEEGEEEEGEEETPGDSTSSGSRKVYQRGITRLPRATIALEHRPVIRPEGSK